MLVLHSDHTVRVSHAGGGVGALLRCWVRCRDCGEKLSRVHFDHTEFSQGVAHAEADRAAVRTVESGVVRYRCQRCATPVQPGEQAPLFLARMGEEEG